MRALSTMLERLPSNRRVRLSTPSTKTIITYYSSRRCIPFVFTLSRYYCGNSSRPTPATTFMPEQSELKRCECPASRDPMPRWRPTTDDVFVDVFYLDFQNTFDAQDPKRHL